MSLAWFKSHAHEASLVVLLALALAGAAWLDPVFLAVGTQLELSSHAFELALLSLPMTLIVISGGIDLSVGSIMAISAVTLGLLYESGGPLWAAACAGLAIGAGAGALNGFFVARVQVHPLIVTLATLAAFRGLAEGISLGRPISGFPTSFLWFGNGAVLGIPVPALVLLPIALVVAWAAAKSVPGFWVYAIGDNEPAARRGGVPVASLKLALYTLCGATAGLAGIFFVARRNTAKADVGLNLELEVITAVVLGGTSIYGGRGTIVGTLLGVALIHEVREFVSWRWHQNELILIVIGLILIGSVVLNGLAFRRRR